MFFSKGRYTGCPDSMNIDDSINLIVLFKIVYENRIDNWWKSIFAIKIFVIGFLYSNIESARVSIWLCVFTNLLFEGLPCGENLSIGHPIIKSFQNSPSACNPAADKAGSARYPKKKHRSAFLVFSNFIRRLGFFHDSRFLVVSRENIGSFCSLSSWGPRTHLYGVLGPRSKMIRISRELLHETAA